MRHVCAYDEPPRCVSRITGTERDAETGLDYFGARYYGSSMGRFTSPDPKMISRQRMFDPQQWNMFQYGRNSPITMIDPDGREVKIATQELQKSFNHLMKSEKFRGAIAPFQGKDRDLIIQRGKLGNDKMEPTRPITGLTNAPITRSVQNCSSATDCTTIPAKLGKTTTVTIDDSVSPGKGKDQIDGVLGHEASHVNDAATEPQRSLDESDHQGEQKHDDRLEEQRADQFSNDVRKEVKEEEQQGKKRKKENPD